jgi:hypothetical protein
MGEGPPTTYYKFVSFSLQSRLGSADVFHYEKQETQKLVGRFFLQKENNPSPTEFSVETNSMFTNNTSISNFLEIRHTHTHTQQLKV